MPHFIVECSENVLKFQSADRILNEVLTSAMDSGLFDTLKNVKVRIRPYPSGYYISYGETEDFIHIFAHIMGGRTSAQKAALSTMLVDKMKTLFPSVPVVSMNVYEFDPASYRNGHMIS